jgi:phosphoglycolate phosphatase
VPHGLATLPSTLQADNAKPMNSNPMKQNSLPQAPPRLAGRPIKAAIIDLDGTMVDTVDDFTAALNTMLAGLDPAGTPPGIARDEVAGYVGKGSEHLIHTVLAKRLEPARAAAQYDAAYERYQEAYAAINGRHTRLYPEVEAGLAALRDAGLALACVTNKPHSFAIQLLEQYGLRHYFQAVYGGDSLARKKPDPLPMLTACRALGVDAAQSVAIGDSENDVMAARAAGMASLTVPYGYNHGNAIQTLNTDGIVASLLDAARFLQSNQ